MRVRIHRSTQHLCYLLLAALSLIALPLPAQSQYEERILAFHSDITVHSESTMTVRETIKVVSAGIQIKRGIYREFPTRYTGKFGYRYIVDFHVVQVLRDGLPEPYHITNAKNGKRVYIGDADVYLPSGEYTYTLTYMTDRQLGYFPDHDELYWNVTGNGWEFPIDEASAVVTLPSGITSERVRIEGYTGLQGSTDKAFLAQVDTQGRAIFHTTRRLAPQEGLTIVVGWPKGFVAEPTRGDKVRYFFRDNLNIILGLLGLAGLLAYYVIAWSRVGNDPERGTIIPIFTPPDGLSPAAVRYITRMGYDNKVLASALINMAVKRYIRISEAAGTYTIEKDKAEEKVLSTEERWIATKLLGGQDSFDLTNSNHLRMQETTKDIKGLLGARYGKDNFSANSIYLIPGLLISLLIVALVVPMGRGIDESAMGMGLAAVLWSIGVAFLLSQVARSWKAASYAPGRLASVGGAVFITLFSIPFVMVELGLIGILALEKASFFVLLLLSLVLVNYLFYQLLKVRTRAGAALLDRIDGFKMYLSIAEEDRLNILNPPDKTPELFEEYLPYALALDVEQAWAEKFSDVLSQAGKDPYQPQWYSGTSWSDNNTRSFASSLGGSLSGAIASSSSPPGSSSGFGGGGGGGGSSGGGGGGGGGGGW